MPLPPFTPLPSADRDAKSPGSEDVYAALVDRSDHVRARGYDLTRHVPVVGHDHDDRNSAGVRASHVPNLLLCSHPSAGWSLTGATHTANGLKFTATGQRATRGLLDPAGNPGASKHVFGQGCDLLLATF